jgi:futalosine hydrolase
LTVPPLPFALLCAVPFECDTLRDALGDPAPVTVGRKAGWMGTLDGTPVLLLPTGMGKVNAAQAATALLETREVRGVVGFGIAGAYPGSGLDTGDVALATAAVYGDEGVHAPDGWMSTEGIGIPLLEAEGVRRFNEFPLDPGRVHAARAALAAAGIAVRTGPFVSVSACSGTAALGREMAARFGALCEGMEGAAVAHVCALYGVPFLEVRAVSNHVEDRDLTRWRMADAAAAAQRAVRVVAAAWRDEPAGDDG